MNPRRFLRGLTSYWRWWRVAILGAATVAIVVALAIDTAALAAILGALALLALGQLIALSGARVDRHHRDLDSHKRRMHGLEVRVEEVATGAARSGSSALRPGELSLLLPLQPRSNSVGLVRSLAEAIPAAEIVVIDRMGADAIGTDLLAAMADHHNVSYLASSASTDIVDDMNDAAVLSSGGFVIPLSRTTAGQDINALVALAGVLPGADELDVGARFSSLEPRFCLLRVGALVEVGGFVEAAGPTGDLIARLRSAGHRVDRGERTGLHRGRRLQAGRLELPSLVGPGHDLSGAVVLAAGTGSAASAIAERTADLVDDEAVWLCPADTWPEVSSVVLRSPHRFFRLPAPAEWLDEVGLIVTLDADDHPEIRRVIGVVGDSAEPLLVRVDNMRRDELAARLAR